MKRKTFLVLDVTMVLGALFVVLSGVVGAQEPEPQRNAGVQAILGTGFTYQGRLNDGGSLASGAYDFEFKLYDDSTNGSQVGSAITATVPITDGLFTVSLDFGNNIFNGEVRWLEIGVRPGGSTVTRTTLSPRQPLTPVPYALALPGLWTQSNDTSPNVIGGYSNNSVTSGVAGATISGGGRPEMYGEGPNIVTDHHGTVGGGENNQAGNDNGITTDAWYATVGGGLGNTARGPAATVGGGSGNQASSDAATVPGGFDNTASEQYAVVGGGYRNWANGYAATIAGGEHISVTGEAATVGGGSWITVTDSYGAVGGGRHNQVGNVNADPTDAAYNTVGGGVFNTASGDGGDILPPGRDHIDGGFATVGGGGANTASAFFATISGGVLNTADNYGATVGGGYGNHATGSYATVSGGANNVISASGNDATIGGGNSNGAGGLFATIGGGFFNTANGDYATVPGGEDNNATGHHSFAAGYRAKANHDGALVWADSTDADFTSTTENQFMVRANGGAVFTGTNDSTAMLNVTNLGSSPGILSNGGSHGVAGYGNYGVYGSGDSYGVYGTSTDTGVYGIGSSYGVYGYSPASGVGLYAHSYSGNLIEAYSGDGSDRELYVSNTGDVYIDGTFNPGGADLAEMLPAAKGLEPGDVLAIGSDGRLTRSTQVYQPTVVGVYSTQPGFLGGAGEDADLSGKIPLAVVGVVPVKASAENGSVRPGDMLTASSIPGYAMKADASPPVGTVIGKALEGLDAVQSTGVILMLVMLQ